MGGAVALAIKVTADARQAKGELDGVSSSLDQKLGDASKKAGVALAGVAAAGIGAALQAEKVASANARVGNVLSNMGMEGATARALDYANSLEKSLGIDEVVIKNTQAKLATFDALAKSAGKAGGMFDRATLAAQDMAAAGFGSAETNAVQLGKALQDPIKGITALAKSGVTFTEAEKNKIKALSESGQAFKAQNIIMKAVEKQVGGTALATADSSAKMKLAFGEVVEQVGTLLLPVMDKAAVFAQKLADVAGKHPKIFIAVGAAIAIVATAIIALNAAFKIATAITRAYTVVQAALNAVMALNPITLVVIAIIALVAGLVLAYKKSETFRKIVDTAFKAVGKTVADVVGFIKTVWSKLFEILKTPIQLAIKAIGTYFKIVGTIVETYFKVIKTVWSVLKDVLAGPFQFLRDVTSTVFGALKAGVRAAKSVVVGAFNGMKATIQAVIDFVQRLIDKIQSIPGIPGSGAAGGIKGGPIVVTPRLAQRVAPTTPVAPPPTPSQADKDTKTMVGLLTKQNSLLADLIRVGSDAPIRFGREINQAAGNAMRR